MTDELETASLGISACYKGLRGTQASRRSEKAFALYLDLDIRLEDTLVRRT